MDIKLERFAVPSAPKIESLAHGELIQLAKGMRERLIIYEGLIFRSKEREFGKVPKEVLVRTRNQSLNLKLTI